MRLLHEGDLLRCFRNSVLVTYVSTLPSTSSSAPCISSFVQSLSTFETNVREWHFVQHSLYTTPIGCRSLYELAITSDTLAGSWGGLCSATSQRVEGIKAGIGTSVTASQMTNAYGASTLRVPHGSSDLSDPSDKGSPQRGTSFLAIASPLSDRAGETHLSS